MNNGLGRELIILVLLFVVIIFTLVILLYDFLPNKKFEEINTTQYSADNSTIEDVLKEIKESTGVDVKEKDSDVPLKSYSIEAKDLNMYASENSYESGKSDPFSENSNPAEEITRLIPKNSTTTENLSPNVVVESEPASSVNTVNSKENNTTAQKNEATANTNSVKTNVNNTVKSNTVKTNTVVANTTSNNTKSNTTTGVYFEERDTK